MAERDKAATRQTILDSVGVLVRKEGFAGLGINALAREAGLSKVLIYRYFGGLEELVREWVLENNYWYLDTGLVEKRIEELLSTGGGADSLREYLAELLEGQMARLRAVPEVREMLRWCLCEESEAASEIMAKVEQRGTDIHNAFMQRLKEKGADAGAMVALLISGIYYLALMADRCSVFNGVALDSEEGWQRISGAVGMILKTLFNNMEVKNET